jgi:formylglycine-generating enzyme required for sulfatase activity
MTPEKAFEQKELNTISIILHALDADAGGQKSGDAPNLSERVSELRSYLQAHYSAVDLTALDPGRSSEEKEKLARQLQATRADQDVELLIKVMQFYDTLLAQPKESAEVIGVNLKDVRANTVNIRDVIVNVHKPDDPPAPGEEPYKGLQYFDVTDAELFFGREKLTAELVDHVRRHSFLAVIGASGSGKSSLVRAGLVAALQKGELLHDGSFPPEGSVAWPALILTPTSRPLENLAEQFIRKFKLSRDSRGLANELLHDPGTLLHAVKQAIDSSQREENHHRARRLILVVDQFEELFTLLHIDNEHNSSKIHQIQQAYIDNLLCAVMPPSQREEYNASVVVILTLRADFYDQCGKFDNLRQALESRQKYIGPMVQDELRQAIERPLQCFDWFIQHGLVELLLDDVGKEPGALPLLSHALLETWKQRSGRTLTFAGYFAIGRVQGAIAETAEKTLRELNPEQQQTAKKVFLRLTEITEDAGATRRRVALSVLLAERPDQSFVKIVLDLLAEKRLITLNKDISEQTNSEIGREDPTDAYEEITVEVAHEALIREWPTLQTWLRENWSALLTQRQLVRAANEWKRHNFEKSYLYQGTRLALALEQSENQTLEFDPLARDFVRASMQAVKRSRFFTITSLIIGTTVVAVLSTLAVLAVNGYLNRLLFPPLPINWVLIKAGEFRMGSTDQDIKFAQGLPDYSTSVAPSKENPFPLLSEYDLSNEQPEHMVYLDNYKISKYETTNKQYYQCVRAGVCTVPVNDKYANAAFENFPVTDINWEDARKFCEWNDALLPTEAEWEKAARAAPNQESRIYPWGDYLSYLPDSNKPVANVAGLNKGVFARPVGYFSTYGESAYGVADMAGNVWEWVRDWYAKNYYQDLASSNPQDPVHNPQGPASGNTHTLRGGSFDNDWVQARSSYRNNNLRPGDTAPDVGFRCVIEESP